MKSIVLTTLPCEWSVSCSLPSFSGVQPQRLWVWIWRPLPTIASASSGSPAKLNASSRHSTDLHHRASYLGHRASHTDSSGSYFYSDISHRLKIFHSDFGLLASVGEIIMLRLLLCTVMRELCSRNRNPNNYMANLVNCFFFSRNMVSIKNNWLVYLV